MAVYSHDNYQFDIVVGVKHINVIRKGESFGYVYRDVAENDKIILESMGFQVSDVRPVETGDNHGERKD